MAYKTAIYKGTKLGCSTSTPRILRASTYPWNGFLKARIMQTLHKSFKSSLREHEWNLTLSVVMLWSCESGSASNRFIWTLQSIALEHCAICKMLIALMLIFAWKLWYSTACSNIWISDVFEIFLLYLSIYVNFHYYFTVLKIQQIARDPLITFSTAKWKKITV